MKNLRKFNSIQDCTNNITSKILPYVYFISDGTIESNDIYINNFPFTSPKLFNILYSDPHGKLSYTSEILPDSLGKMPIALCIAPEDFFGTGEKARWMSLKYMNFNSPDTGSTTSQNMVLSGNSENTYLQSYTSTHMGTNSSWGNFTASWTTSSDNKIPSLIDNNGNWNLSELGNVNTYISTDIEGKNNTNLMLQHATGQENWRTDQSIEHTTYNGIFPAICCCARYHTLGTQPGDWYLGAAGENSIMIYYTPEINTILQQIHEVYPYNCMTSIITGSQVYWTSSYQQGIYFTDIFFNNNGQNAGIGYDQATKQFSVIAMLQY